MTDEIIKVAVRLTKAEHQTLKARGDPTEIATGLLKEYLRSGEEFPVKSSFSGPPNVNQNHLNSTLKELQIAVSSLNDTAQFRQLTRNEIIEYIAAIVKHAPEIEKQHINHLNEINSFQHSFSNTLKLHHKNHEDLITSSQKMYSDRLQKFFDSILTTIDGLNRIDEEVKDLKWVINGHKDVNTNIENIAKKAAAIDKTVSSLETSVRNHISHYDMAYLKTTKRWILWGFVGLGIAIALSILTVVTLRYVEFFRPDAAWCKYVLFGK